MKVTKIWTFFRFHIKLEAGVAGKSICEKYTKELCCNEANLPINDSRPPSYHRLPADCRVGLLAQSSFMTHLFQLQQLKMAHLNSGTFFFFSKNRNKLSFHSQRCEYWWSISVCCVWMNELNAYKGDSVQHFWQLTSSEMVTEGSHSPLCSEALLFLTFTSVCTPT